MDEPPQSPILSCKKYTRKASALTVSPVLSNRKKRRKQEIDDSPVFIRQASKSTVNGGESPVVIESFLSPPFRNESPNCRGLKPKSLFPDSDYAHMCLASTNSQETIINEQQHFIEDDSLSTETEDEDLIIHEKSLSDNEEMLDFTQSTSRSDISFATSQACSSFYSGQSTPEKKVMQLSHVSTGSARKKKQYLPNGLAKKLSRLLIRQETDWRLWRFQHKIDSSSDPSNSSQLLRLRIESVSIGNVHSFAHCRLESGNLTNDRVSLVFSPERWERFGVRAGDIVSIYEPWYSSMAMGGVTLLLGFNLLLRKGVAASEVSKLSNTIRCDGACSSASADSYLAAVAENRRPSTVTVLQTWSCPSQGKEFSRH